MGYASIVLSVITFAVLARVLATQAPQLKKMISEMGPAAVSTQQEKINLALQQYKADVGQLPALSPTNGEEVDLKALIGILAGKNAKGKIYYAAGGNGIYINGLPVHVGMQPLHVALALNNDGTVVVGETQVAGSCAVWSVGPNKTNENGGGDDVVSW